MRNAYTLPPATVQDYARQGAVVLRGVLTPDDVATLARGIEHNLAHLSPLALVASQADDPGKFVEDFCTWQHNPDYADVMQHSALPRVAAQVMQSDTVRTFRDQQAKWFPEGALAELPQIDAHPDQFEQLGWALQPGDAVAFHMLTLHASSGVGPGTRRRVFSARYLGDDARHAVRSWRTSPPFPGLADRLPDGAVMDDALFPLLNWR